MLYPWCLCLLANKHYRMFVFPFLFVFVRLTLICTAFEKNYDKDQHCALKWFQVCYHIAKQAEMLHQSNVNAIKNVLDLTMTTPTTISMMTTTTTSTHTRTHTQKNHDLSLYFALWETEKACRPIFNGRAKQTRIFFSRAQPTNYGLNYIFISTVPLCHMLYECEYVSNMRAFKWVLAFNASTPN